MIASPKMTWQDVDRRLREAARTLQAMPMDRPRGYRVMWPDVPKDAQTAYGYYGDPLNLYRRERQMPDIRVIPSPAEIDRMDEVLGWLAWLPKDEGMIVEAVARGIYMVTLARKLGCHAVTIRRVYRRGCQMIASRLQGY